MKKNISKKRSAPLGASFVVLSSFFYASYGIWTKLMGDLFDGYTAAALRSMLVVLMLLPVALWYRKFEPLRLKENWRYMAGMLISSLFIWGPLYYAILHAGVGVSLTINYASIVIGMCIFGSLLAGEHFTKEKAMSTVLGILGLLLIFSPTFTGLAWLGLVAALVSGFATAADMVCAKKIHYNSTQSTIVLWAVSILANIIMALLLHKSYPAFAFQAQWFYLVLFSVASVVASWLLVRGMKLIDAGTAGILGLLEIVFGVAFGVIFFQEHPSIATLLGVVVIIIAAAIPYLNNLKAE